MAFRSISDSRDLWQFDKKSETNELRLFRGSE